MFDGAEMGLFSLVGRPAVKDLLNTQDEALVSLWFGIVIAFFLVGAATGGVLFGWLGDRIGRVRAMALSVLTYALFTGLCGFATDAWQVGLLRFIGALGMGGEWSLGVALVMEVWPNRSRALMAALIGAAANVGYLLVGYIALLIGRNMAVVEQSLQAMGLSADTTGELVDNGAWRLLMILGVTPALLTFLIRLFVPESHRWEEEKRQGATTHWAASDLWGVALGILGPAAIIYLWSTAGAPYALWIRIAGTLAGLAVAVAGYTFPVLRFLQRGGSVQRADQPGVPILYRMVMAACLSGVALVGTWGSAQWAPSYAQKLTEAGIGITSVTEAREQVQIWLAIGAIIGTILAALIGGWLGRRLTYSLMCLTAFGSTVFLYQFHHAYGTSFLVATTFVGICTASFYGWLPLYLPELFPTRVRATAQGFSFNFGRIIAAIGALQAGNLVGMFPHDVPFGGILWKGAYPLACTTISLVYIVGFLLIWCLPETKGQPLPD